MQKALLQPHQSDQLTVRYQDSKHQVLKHRHIAISQLSGLTPMSDTHQNLATLSLDKVAYQFSIGNQTIAKQACLLVTHDIISSSALLIASTLYQRRQVNVNKHKHINKQLTNHSSATEQKIAKE